MDEDDKQKADKTSKRVQTEEAAYVSAVEIPEAVVVTKKLKKKKWWVISAFIGLFILFAGAVVVAGYFYMQSTKQAIGTPKEINEVEQVMAELAQLMELPEGKPTLATVTDKSKLSSQSFFQKAENGDMVLLFTEAKRAVLYRPSVKKIIDITTINIADGKTDQTLATTQTTESIAQQTDESTTQIETAAEETPVTRKVALYNGTTKIGVTNGMEDQIVSAFPSVVVEKKEKAAKNDYQSNLVIDLSGQNTTLAEEIAASIGGTVGSALPEGEIHPNTDLLIIAGNK